MSSLTFPAEPILCPSFVGGKFQKGSGPQILVNSPYTGKQVGVIFANTKNELDQVVSAAQRAAQSWKQTPLKERCQIMFQWRTELLQKKQEIAQCISMENGKMVVEALASLSKGIEVLEFALSLQNLDLGGRMEVSRGVFCHYQREPLGVVAGITPFNFPAMVPMWMMPIALTLGNAFVWKPSEKTPLTSRLIVECGQRAGLPEGILSVVHGGKDIVDHIIQHPHISAIGFVGSTPVARYVYQEGTRHLKRVLALGGAKNHIILLPDAPVAMASQGIMDSFTGCAGQRCMAASVLLAVGNSPAIEEIIQQIKLKAGHIQLGPEMGAIINEASLKFLTSSIGEAQQAGAKILLDGRGKMPLEKNYVGGYWLGPTILDHVTPGSPAATTELFGPVLSIIRCKDLSEAIAIENSCGYGNAASVFTQNGGLAQKVVQTATSAMVGINIGVPVPREPFSFGGMNQSKFGHGEITGHGSLDFWSNQKKVTEKWFPQADQNWMN